MSSFTPAKRTMARARVALCGPSGSGKSLSALLLATGLGGKIAAIDTEHNSLSLYDDRAEFDTCAMAAPYSPKRYIALIAEAEAAGYDTIIIDSLTHEWTGPGGILDIHQQVTESSKSRNSFVAWKEVTPQHDALIQKMLSSPCHIIATVRTKTGYSQGEDKQYHKVGMEIQQRDGLDYEFTVVFDLAIPSHIATASKDRTGLFDGQHQLITPDTGKVLAKWLAGAKPETQVDAETGEIAGEAMPTTPPERTPEEKAERNKLRTELAAHLQSLGLEGPKAAKWIAHYYKTGDTRELTTEQLREAVAQAVAELDADAEAGAQEVA